MGWKKNGIFGLPHVLAAVPYHQSARCSLLPCSLLPLPHLSRGNRFEREVLQLNWKFDSFFYGILWQTFNIIEKHYFWMGNWIIPVFLWRFSIVLWIYQRLFPTFPKLLGCVKQLLARWWFGTFLIFPSDLGMSSSQLTFIFFRGVAQPPNRWYSKLTSMI